MLNSYKEGAYYYTKLKFSWEHDAWSNCPSIYATCNSNIITIPFLKNYCETEIIPVMYFPFIYKDTMVNILDDSV